MFNTLKRFFEFCNEENRKKFYLSLVLGLVLAVFEAFRVPAIYIMTEALVNDNVTINTIISCLGIMIISIVAGSIVRYKTTMLQTEGGIQNLCKQEN